MYYPLMNRYDYWGLGFGMSILWFLAVVIIGIIFIRLLRRHEWRDWYHHQAPAAGKNDPLDIAKERYAKGEITKDEFEQLKKDLK